MTRPAARVLDTHTCPASLPYPHVGGVVAGPGVASVMIGNRPAAPLGTTCACVVPGNAITGGSSSVVVGNRPAARLGDTTSHGGALSSGCSSVLIGG